MERLEDRKKRRSSPAEARVVHTCFGAGGGIESQQWRRTAGGEVFADGESVSSSWIVGIFPLLDPGSSNQPEVHQKATKLRTDAVRRCALPVLRGILLSSLQPKIYATIFFCVHELLSPVTLASEMLLVLVIWFQLFCGNAGLF